MDIELADAVQRLRFEHPQVRAVVVTSADDRTYVLDADGVAARPGALSDGALPARTSASSPR